jgi:hypothetical protein
MYKVDDRYIIEDAKRYVIEFAIREADSIPGLDFFNKDLDDPQRTKFKACCLALSEHGLALVHRCGFFKHERDEIFAYTRTTKKAYKEGIGLIRFPCFRKVDRWIFTHGFWKPRKHKKWPESEFERAFEIRNEVIEREKKALR